MKGRKKRLDDSGNGNNLAIIIPTFNERDNIKILLPILLDLLKKHEIT
ncbi:MAG: hypothetical protein ACFFCS_29180, partial [Candidatus Hodarchaeota archaeon]